ncbi:MAG: hypothetical protein ACK559_26920, partial [bacterium]
ATRPSAACSSSTRRPGSWATRRCGWSSPSARSWPRGWRWTSLRLDGDLGDQRRLDLGLQPLLQLGVEVVVLGVLGLERDLVGVLLPREVLLHPELDLRPVVEDEAPL